MNKNKLTIFVILILLINIFFFNLIHATSIESLGTFKEGECIDLKQTCANCTYVNFTRVSYPNSSRALGNTNTTKEGSIFYYYFCNTSELGTYIVEGIGDVDGVDTIFTYEFYITPNGFQLGTSNAINFNIAIIILIGLFLLSIIGIFTVGDYKGKFALYWVAHVLFVVGTFSIWQFNENYELGYFGLSGTFKILFYVSITALFPMVILSLAWIFYIHLMNDDIQKMMKRGMNIDEAISRSRRKRRW